MLANEADATLSVRRSLSSRRCSLTVVVCDAYGLPDAAVQAVDDEDVRRPLGLRVLLGVAVALTIRAPVGRSRPPRF